jgi:hypothetical protein
MLPIDFTDEAWPLMTWAPVYADYLQYDWYSGLFEVSDEAIAKLSQGFGSWLHCFHVLAEVN